MLAIVLGPRRGAALTLLAASCAVAGLANTTAQARSATVKVAVPAGGQVTAALGKARVAGRPSVRIRGRAPRGVVAAGGVTRSGRLAVMVGRLGGAGGARASASARRTVTFAIRGAKARVRGLKTVPRAIEAGGRSCASGLGTVLARSLALGGRPKRDVSALGALVARRLCGAALTDADRALLARLGLAAPRPSTPGSAPSSGPRPSLTGGGSLGGGPAPLGGGRPGGGSGGSGGGSEPSNACRNGVDDDGDGQTDANGQGAARPDPGCLDEDDSTEAGEVPVSAECASASGVGQSTEDRKALFVGINRGCGDMTVVWVNVAPKAIACRAFTSESNFSCGIASGNAVSWATDGRATDIVDMTIDLVSDADCDVPATIALTRPDGLRAELIEPIGGCTEGPGSFAQCSNGIDDDADGRIDDRAAAGATNPDAGCTSTTDTTESSERPLPDGCWIEVLTGKDPRLIGVRPRDCGPIEGLWLRPPGTPTNCGVKLGDGPFESCTVTGVTVGATFEETGDDVVLATTMRSAPDCDVDVTVALLRSGGEVDSITADLC